MRIINRTVLVLSVVSLLADAASEMLYPVMPVYLKSIGFSVLLMGILEGVAEATAGISKGYFGQWSDRRGERLPFIKLGYALSALSKPLMAAFTQPWWVFGARTTDRLGKGLRTAARDAVLAHNSTPQTKARVFSFHRGMDTVGAIIGPAAALLYLHWHPAQYRTLFFIAFLPGVLSVLALWLLKEQKVAAQHKTKHSFFGYFRYWKTAPTAYRKLALPLLLFAAVNSADAFLLLRMKEVTGSDTATIGAYIFYNAVYALAAYPLGALADRWNGKNLMAIGLLLFAGTYCLFALGKTAAVFWLGFSIYGVYAAATEGIAKALLAGKVEHNFLGTGLGLFTSLNSLCSLLASLWTGWVWLHWGAAAALFTSALIAAGVGLWLWVSADKN